MIIKKERFKKILAKKRFSQIRKIQKDSRKKKRFSQMITNKNKCVQINFHSVVEGNTNQ